MQPTRDVQAQLRSLSIAKEQRPAAKGAASRGIRWLLTLFVLLGIAGVGYATRDRIVPAVREFTTGTAEVGPVQLLTVALTAPPGPAPALTATGKVVSDHTVSVATKVSGQVVALFFEQGDRVEQEQVLAHIEDILYRARRDEAAARLERSRATLQYQQINFARVEGLVKLESAPSIELDDARRWLDEAKAQVKADQATLAFNEKTLKDCVVVAPISGVILQRNVEVGDFVAAEGGIGAMANARFAVIADMDNLRVEVDISELDIARLKKDMPCAIVPDAYKDRRYRGRVMWLDPGANYSKATVQVKVRIDDPDSFLRVEGSAQVTFLTGSPEKPEESADLSGSPGMWIPAAALLANADGSAAVFAAVDGRLEKRVVTTGRRQGDRVEIISGLSPGDSIAGSGLDRLTDGQRTR